MASDFYIGCAEPGRYPGRYPSRFSPVVSIVFYGLQKKRRRLEFRHLNLACVLSIVGSCPATGQHQWFGTHSTVPRIEMRLVALAAE